MPRRVLPTRRVRANCESWHELQAELLVCIARHCDASELVAFAQVCRSWNESVLGETLSSMWKKLLLDRFPRAAALTNLLAAREISFQQMYREQLEAEVDGRGLPEELKPPSCRLADFLFTFELVSEKELPPPRVRQLRSGRRLADDDSIEMSWKRRVQQTVVRSWSGHLEPVEEVENAFRVPMRWSEWKASWQHEDGEEAMSGDTMRLIGYVSRICGDRLLTRRFFVSDTCPDFYHETVEGNSGNYFFECKPIAYAPAFYSSIEPEMAINMDTTSADELTIMCCSWDIDHHTHDDLTLHEVLAYLDRGIAW